MLRKNIFLKMIIIFLVMTFITGTYFYINVWADTRIKDGSLYRIKNVNSGLYLEVKDGIAANGSNVQQGNANKKHNTWRVKFVGDGYCKLISQTGDGKSYVLDVAAYGTANFTNVQIYSDNGIYASNQLFKFKKITDKSYAIVTKITNDRSCLDVYNYNLSNGGNIMEYAYKASLNQLWILEEVAGENSEQKIETGGKIDQTVNNKEKRRMEALDRGVVAMYTGSSAFISWRLLGTDDEKVSFNIYRAAGTGSPVLLNKSPLTKVTNWTDKEINISMNTTYTVKAVTGGKEEPFGESFTIPCNSTAKQYLSINLTDLRDSKGDPYYVEHIYAGDLNGDGRYDLVVKRMSDNRDPVIVEAYELNGAFLWRIKLGSNIETGSANSSPILVADFDGNGKAEVMMKTAEETIFGDNMKIGDTNHDGLTDYNSHDPNDIYQVLKGPEFISMVKGETGEELDRMNFIKRGKITDWGDDNGYRMNFIYASTAYLDGRSPSMILSRGSGKKKALTAYALDFKKGKFKRRWVFKAKNYKKDLQEFDSIKAVDLDADGKDEVSWGGFALNENGSLLYSTGLAKGESFVIADIDPNRSGLECFATQKKNGSLMGTVLYDADTGKIIEKKSLSHGSEVKQGDAASILDNVYGMQMWSSAFPGFWTADGKKKTSFCSEPSLSIWWDGDLTREFIEFTGSSVYSPVINKWNTSDSEISRLFSICDDGGKGNVISSESGGVPLYADLFGDWREEIIFETSDHAKLRVYTTTIETEYRFYTLMHNPAYRNCVNVKGGLSSTQTDYYFGAKMNTNIRFPNIITH